MIKRNLALAALLTGCAFSSASGDDDPGADAAAGPDRPDAAGSIDAANWPWPDAGTEPTVDAAVLAGRNGYPGDFPELTDSGGSGQGQIIQGFGGDDTTDRAGNRAQLVRRPVILLHGNGTTATDDTFGVGHLRDKLLAAGYNPAEIWAPSYLGQNVAVAETPTPHRTNIGDIRTFVDEVAGYLGVDRVDVVAHSLGCGMINGYLRGLTSVGNFDVTNDRWDRVGTVVCLGGALYGTGNGFLYEPEFNVSGSWVAASLTWQGIEDATPFGAATVGAMTAPPTGQIPGGRPFREASSLDDGTRRIYWVALWSNGDIVDGNLPFAGGLQGADLNRGFDLPDTLPGVITAQLARHGQLVHDQGVFDAFVGYLNR